ncbi:MAG: hypothetical protein PVG25_07320, partial [Anaerolineae bacterium]
ELIPRHRRFVSDLWAAHAAKPHSSRGTTPPRAGPALTHWARYSSARIDFKAPIGGFGHSYLRLPADQNTAPDDRLPHLFIPELSHITNA